MKKTLGLAMVGGLLALGIGQSQAQSTNTLQLQTLNVNLTGFSGGEGSNATPIKIGSKDVINSILGSSAPKSAKLQMVSNGDGTESFFVTSGSGKNVTAIDVSSLFSHGIFVGPLTKGKTSYSIDSYSFGTSSDTNISNASLTFSLQGFTTTQSNGAFNSQVNGSGTDTSGGTAVLKGTITGSAPSKGITVTIQGGGGGGGGTNTTSTVTP